MNYHVSSNWGGARNFAGRSSDYLTFNQCLKIESAVEKSISRGVALNRFVTINWSLMGLPPKQGASATMRFFKLATDWAKHQGQAIHWAYVREANANGLNHHVHILIHIPDKISKAFFLMTRRWIETTAARKYQRRTILTRSIGARVQSYSQNYESYADNLKTLVRNYLFKGASKEAVQGLELPLWARGGLIYGKRCGRSKSLGNGNPRQIKVT
jgi:hypothetical protein